MIACNSTEGSVCNVLPQAVYLVLRAQRRRTFEESTLLQNILIGHGKIVRAGFCGDVITLALRCGNSVGNIGAAYMADVHSTAGCLCQLDDGGCSNHFGCNRTGV